MMIAALLTSAVTAFTDMPDLSPDMKEFAQEASVWVLEGRELPPDYRPKLKAMNPTDRLQAIIFLRRSGLLREDIWSLDDLLDSSTTKKQVAK